MAFISHSWASVSWAGRGFMGAVNALWCLSGNCPLSFLPMLLWWTNVCFLMPMLLLSATHFLAPLVWHCSQTSVDGILHAGRERVLWLSFQAREGCLTAVISCMLLWTLLANHSGLLGAVKHSTTKLMQLHVPLQHYQTTTKFFPQTMSFFNNRNPHKVQRHASQKVIKLQQNSSQQEAKTSINMLSWSNSTHHQKY